jgi:hypothetical protein
MRLGNRVAISFAAVVIALASMGAMDSALAANLLANPDFETGDLTGWQVFGESPSSTVTVAAGDNGPSAPGTYSVFMDNQAEALGLVLKQSTLPGTASPGDVDYSFDLKLDQADVGGVFFVQMFAEQSGVGIVGGSGLLGPFWAWGAWQTFAGSFVAPEGTDFLTIQLTATTGAATGSNCLMHVDNVVLSQAAVPVDETTWGSMKALYR